MSEQRKYAQKAPDVHSPLFQKKYRVELGAHGDLVPTIVGAYRPANNGVGSIDYSDQQLANRFATDEAIVSKKSPNAITSIGAFDQSKRNSSQAYGTTVGCTDLRLYPQSFVRSGILATDLLYNVPCQLLSIQLYSNRLNQVIPIELRYALHGSNVTPSDDKTGPRGSANTITTILSRHRHMTATAGCYCVAVFLGTEWRPVYIEDSPCMRFGNPITVGKTESIDVPPVVRYDYYAKYWWWRTKPENKLTIKKWE